MLTERKHLLFIALIVALLMGGGVSLASSGFTGRTVEQGKAELNQCLKTPRPARFNCVSDALDRVDRTLQTKSRYERIGKVIRQAAAKVRATRKLSVALSAIAVAKKQFLRAHGLAKPKSKLHYVYLTSLMDRARSVLRR